MHRSCASAHTHPPAHTHTCTHVHMHTCMQSASKAATKVEFCIVVLVALPSILLLVTGLITMRGESKYIHINIINTSYSKGTLLHACMSVCVHIHMYSMLTLTQTHRIAKRLAYSAAIESRDQVTAIM